MSTKSQNEEAEATTDMEASAPSKNGVVKVLDRDSILASSDIVTEKVEVPEWGGIVYVRSMTGRERDEFEESILVEKRERTRSGFRTTRQASLSNFRAKLAARVTYDAEGNRIFTDADASKLGEKNSAPLQRIVAKAQELSGMTDEDVEDLVDELGKDQN